MTGVRLGQTGKQRGGQREGENARQFGHDDSGGVCQSWKLPHVSSAATGNGTRSNRQRPKSACCSKARVVALVAPSVDRDIRASCDEQKSPRLPRQSRSAPAEPACSARPLTTWVSIPSHPLGPDPVRTQSPRSLRTASQNTRPTSEQKSPKSSTDRDSFVDQADLEAVIHCFQVSHNVLPQAR